MGEGGCRKIALYHPKLNSPKQTRDLHELNGELS